MGGASYLKQLNVDAMHDARAKRTINMARQDNNGIDISTAEWFSFFTSSRFSKQSLGRIMVTVRHDHLHTVDVGTISSATGQPTKGHSRCEKDQKAMMVTRGHPTTTAARLVRAIALHSHHDLG
jgi:hypothetical protein